VSVTGYVLLPELFTATEIGRLRDVAERVHATVVSATDRRSLLYCFQPAGRPELSALTYDAERLADLP